ncbi:MAG: NUDIX domain-containing protein [Leptolyngbyaceae cyanobacterium]
MSEVIEAIAWICLQNRQVLCTRTRGKDVFYMPGGKLEPGESAWQALRREIREELSVDLVADTLTESIVVEAWAHGYSKQTRVRMKCFQADYRGEITPNSEIEEIAWFSLQDRKQCAPAAQKVLEYLNKHQLIN